MEAFNVGILPRALGFDLERLKSSFEDPLLHFFVMNSGPLSDRMYFEAPSLHHLIQCLDHIACSQSVLNFQRQILACELV